MTRHLVFVLGDQLSRGLSALSDFDPVRDVVLMVEVAEEADQVPHHKQKLVLILSAMRHFAQSLREEGINVDYVTLEDPANSQGFTGELARAVARHRPKAIIMTEPGEWRVAQMIAGWGQALDLPVQVRSDGRFICSRDDFAALTRARKTGRMEYFYREMRRRTGFLMRGAEPEGGAWNYDTDNRKSLPRGHRPPARRRFSPDGVTQAVMQMVATRFSGHFGDLEPFGWAVTREGALEALDHFITDALPRFGDFQDAMKAGDDFLYHGLISPYLNLGLLTAREVCTRAEAVFHRGDAPLNAVEGFIRQIVGWREFVRGVYWAEMPDYGRTNHLKAQRDLPGFYWTGETPMRCMAECIGTTRRTGYAHHIQRLMVTGNFALLAGIAPAQVEEWYLAVYVDAFDWVELPNTHGMVLHADGGRLGSKPYAASGAYINRMSDYCSGCQFDPRKKLGPDACPFNSLYWNFLIENGEMLAGNPRMALPYRNLARMDVGQRQAITAAAQDFLAGQKGWQMPKDPPRQASLDDTW